MTSGETRKKRLNAEHTENAEATERRKSRKEGFNTEGAEKTPRPGRAGVNEWRVTSGETRRKDLTQGTQRTQRAQRGEEQERGI